MSSEIRKLTRTDLLQLVQIVENADQSNRLGRIEKLLRKLLELDLQGADLFRGYILNVAAVTTPQRFSLEQFLLPTRLTGLTATVTSGTLNDQDLFSLRIVDEDQKPEFLDLLISNIPLGLVNGEFDFRKGHAIPPFARLEVLWQNAVANSKTVALAASLVRDFGSPQDSANL